MPVLKNISKAPLYAIFFLGIVAMAATIAALQIIDDCETFDLAALKGE